DLDERDDALAAREPQPAPARRGGLLNRLRRRDE
ncbi:MAG: hypothetical protein QOI55_706, partial [Actinomycetota bacterium]|nr:hypothetical protein [Actinomycetota bacterium]